MKLKDLNDFDTFKTDTGIIWQKLPLILKNKAQQIKYKDRFKCQRLDTNEVYYLLDNMHVIKHKKEN